MTAMLSHPALLARQLFFFACLGLAGAAAAAPFRIDTLSSAARHAAQSVLRVDVVVPVGVGRISGAETQVRATNGAGFVIEPDGRIVTAAHVVADALEIRVVVAPGDVRSAQVIGYDRLTDVAVIEVHGDLPPALSIADDVPELARPVAAIGAPYGMDRAVSFGVVGGTARARRPGATAIYLQHDAAVNPGNSGGPVITSDGRVVGLNVAIPDGQFEFSGIGFAVEAPILGRVVQEIVAQGAVLRGTLGATFRAIDPLTQVAIENADIGAAVVIDLDPEGPAAQAGMQIGDIVRAVDGTRPDSLSDLLRLLDDTRAGDEVSFDLQRGPEAEQRSVAVTLALSTDEPRRSAGLGVNTGLEIALGTPARVHAVSEGSLAAVAQLEPGDAILSVNLQPVRDGQEARARLAAITGLTVVLAQRGSGSPRLLVLGADPSEAGVLGGNSLGILSGRR